MSFSGVETANVSRLHTYASAELPGLLKECDCECDLLAEAVGDQPYTTPLNDMAPWVDPDDPDTWGFYGTMPVTVTGLQDSTREYQIVGNIGDGAVIGRERHGPLEFRVTHLLAARNAASLEAGYSWLKAVADGGCAGPCGTGMKFCYLSSCPVDLEDMGSPEEHVLEVFTSVPPLNGPRVLNGIQYTSRFNPPLPCGEIRWTLSMDEDPDWIDFDTPAITGVAQVGATELGVDDIPGPGQADIVVMSSRGPVYSLRVDVDDQIREFVISDNGQGQGALWVEIHGGARLHAATLTANTGTVAQSCRDKYLRQLHNVVVSEGPRIIRDMQPSGGGALRLVEMVYTAVSPRTFRATIDIAGSDRGSLWSAPGVGIDILDHDLPLCERDEPSWREILANPLCPLDPPPPLPPTASGNCAPRTAYNASYEISIPDGIVPEWTEMVPTLSIRAGEQGVHGVRVRFLANPLNLRADEIDPCAECSSYAINYIPRGTTLTVDGRIERAYVQAGDQTFSARHNLFSTRPGAEFSWPSLACGIGYLVVVEIAANSDIEELSLSLTSRE